MVSNDKNQSGIDTYNKWDGEISPPEVLLMALLTSTKSMRLKPKRKTPTTKNNTKSKKKKKE